MMKKGSLNKSMLVKALTRDDLSCTKLSSCTDCVNRESIDAIAANEPATEPTPSVDTAKAP